MFTEFLKRVFIEGNVVVMNPHGAYGLTSLGRGASSVSLQFRDFFFPKDMLKPERESELRVLLETHLKQQLMAENIEQFKKQYQRFFKFYILDDEAFNQLIEVVAEKFPQYKDFAHSAKVKGVRLSDILPANVKKELVEIMNSDAKILQFYSENLLSTIKKYFVGMFGFNESFLALLPQKGESEKIKLLQFSESFFASAALGDAARQMELLAEIHQWRANCALQHLTSVIADMRYMVNYDYQPTPDAIKLKELTLRQLNKFIDNPRTKDIFQVVFNDPDLMLIVANAFDVSQFFARGLTQKSASGTYQASSKKILLSHSVQHGFIYEECGVVHINRTSSNLDLCFDYVMYDEFNHALMHILSGKNNFPPYWNSQQEAQYRQAIVDDRQYIAELVSITNKIKAKAKLTAHETTVWKRLFNAIKDYFKNETLQGRLEYNNQPGVVAYVHNREGEKFQLPQVYEEATDCTVTKIIPPNALNLNEPGVILTFSALKELSEKHYFDITKDFIEKTNRILYPSEAYTTFNNDIREIINHLFFNLGRVTKLLMPNIEKYFQEVILPAAKEKLMSAHNASIPVDEHAVTDADHMQVVGNSISAEFPLGDRLMSTKQTAFAFFALPHVRDQLPAMLTRASTENKPNMRELSAENTFGLYESVAREIAYGHGNPAKHLPLNEVRTVVQAGELTAKCDSRFESCSVKMDEQTVDGVNQLHAENNAHQFKMERVKPYWGEVMFSSVPVMAAFSLFMAAKVLGYGKQNHGTRKLKEQTVAIMRAKIETKIGEYRQVALALRSDEKFKILCKADQELFDKKYTEWGSDCETWLNGFVYPAASTDALDTLMGRVKAIEVLLEDANLYIEAGLAESSNLRNTR